MAVGLISAGVLALVAAVLLFGLVGLRRDGLLPRARLTLPLVSCFLLLIVAVASDWPGSRTSTFWSDHVVLAVLAAVVPLLGIAYFGYESHVARTEDELDQNVAALGRSAVLDHLITLDAALSEPGRADLMQASEDLLAVIHAWAPLLSRSREGRNDLIRVGGLQQRLGHTELPDDLRQECRRLAWDLAGKCNARERDGLARP
ncbi:MAG: hypothetical protein ACTH2Q_03650 [Propionibacteriaceae bacterium]